MAPCERYTFEECVEQLAMLNATTDQDANVLCVEKNDIWISTISSATVAIIIYLLTNVYIQIADFSLALETHHVWGNSHNKKGKGTSSSSSSSPHCYHEEGRKAFFNSMIINLICWFLVYIGTTVLFHVLSHPLDRRASAIVVGFSQIFAGIVFLDMSLHFPQWFGIYGSNQKESSATLSCTSGKAIQFHLSRTLWKHLISMLFFNFYFCAADTGWRGFLIGVPFSFVIIGVTYLGRTKYEKYKHTICIGMGTVFGIASWYTVFTGIKYVFDVWLPSYDKHQRTLDAFGYSMIWIVVLISCHIVMWNYWSTRSKKQSTRTSSPTTTTAAAAVDKTMPRGSIDIDKEGQEDSAYDMKTTVEHGTEVEGITSEDNAKIDYGTNNGGDGDNLVRNGYVGPNDAPSYWRIMREGQQQQTQTQPPKTCLEKTGDWMKQYSWYILSFFFFAMAVINVLASYEQCAAKNALPTTFAKLYPEGYTQGTMCAWDTTQPPGPNSTIKTFETLQDVQDANYEVIHCGACAACSNWNDIQLQYTSRKVLAGVTKTCAQKSIFRKINVTDDNDIVVQCNHLQVGFTLPCSKAWSWDELNTKKHAIFTFLQAHLSNSFSDMQVSFTDITMATIDEALSGPTFVPEVGATRRRMNIISDIPRPDYQQCTSVQQNWTEVFNDTFFPPCGGTYVIESSNKPSKKYVIPGQNDPC